MSSSSASEDSLLTVLQNPCSLGNHECPSTTDKARCTHRHHELCCHCLALVQSLFLRESQPNIWLYHIHTVILTTTAPFSRAALSERWRSDHRRCWDGHCRLSRNEVVCAKEEQADGRVRSFARSTEGMEVRGVSLNSKPSDTSMACSITSAHGICDYVLMRRLGIVCVGRDSCLGRFWELSNYGGDGKRYMIQ
jgi:hypothetical protein